MKMDPVRTAMRMKDARTMFDFSLGLCRQQAPRGRGFVLEHPNTASSWHLASFVKTQQDLAAIAEVVSFDQCMVGLRSPSKVHMKKRTKLFKNVQMRQLPSPHTNSGL